MVQRPAFRRSLDLIERYPIGFVLLFRFAYGLRAVATVAIGASRISTRLFVSLNIVAAALWGALFTALGHYFGPAFETMAARYGWGVTAAVIGLSVLLFFLALRRSRR